MGRHSRWEGRRPYTSQEKTTLSEASKRVCWETAAIEDAITVTTTSPHSKLRTEYPDFFSTGKENKGAEHEANKACRIQKWVVSLAHMHTTIRLGKTQRAHPVIAEEGKKPEKKSAASSG
jgi:hypothetical protein